MLSKSFFMAAGLVLAISGCSTSRDLEPHSIQSPIHPASGLLTEILEADGGPGIMAAVAIDGELVWSDAQGFADLERGIPLTPDTRMRIGSVSKPITAAAALRLVDAGSIRAFEPVLDLIPEVSPPDDRSASLNDLAGHISGIRQYDFGNYLEANNIYFHPNLAAALGNLSGDIFKSRPGEVFEYSSLGYNLMGMVLERVTDKSFDQVLFETVTDPLQLSNTLIDHPLQIVAKRTRFYTRFPDGSVMNTIWRDSSDFYPSGGILSTAEDLVVLTNAVFSDDWLSPKTRQLPQTEITTRGGVATGYTFGWQIMRNENGDVVSYEHGGETNGAYAFVKYIPEERMALAAIVNANFAAGEPVFFEAISDKLPPLFAAE